MYGVVNSMAELKEGSIKVDGVSTQKSGIAHHVSYCTGRDLLGYVSVI